MTLNPSLRSTRDHGLHLPLHEHAVPLVAPPDTIATSRADEPPIPPLPPVRSDSPLVLGTATVDHSGRVRDRTVLEALGWHPGDHTRTTIGASGLILRRTRAGGVPIDARGRVFLPAGARALFGIGKDQRIVLVAAPQQELLVVHPTQVVTSLLAHHYNGK